MPRLSPRVMLLLSATFTFALCVWWSILLHRLTMESYDQQVQLFGPASEAALMYARRSKMIAGESIALLSTTLLLLGLGWRASMVESRQAQRMRVLFAASTHELKTPIAGLKALLESLQSGVLPPEIAAPHLARGLDACDRLERLVESMLIRQAVLTGESPKATRTLSEWLAPVLERRALHPRERVEVSLGTAGEANITLPGDALRVVIDNLLDNAMKYAPGKPVKLTARREGRLVQLDVTDQGAGFDPEDSARLFHPWERGRKQGTPSGTGLGLYLARAIAREASGDLTASSAGPGKGATFTVRLNANE